MSFIKSLFSESSDVSMMRLLSLISLIIGAYLALHDKNACVDIFVYGAFGGKAVQKLIESKKSV